MKDKSSLGTIAWILVIVGAINWGLVGILKVDIVATIFGNATTISRVVYTLVGLSGIYLLATASKKSA